MKASIPSCSYDIALIQKYEEAHVIHILYRLSRWNRKIKTNPRELCGINNVLLSPGRAEVAARRRAICPSAHPPGSTQGTPIRSGAGRTPRLPTVPEQSRANPQLTLKVHKLELIFLKRGAKNRNYKGEGGKDALSSSPPLPKASRFCSSYCSVSIQTRP